MEQPAVFFDFGVQIDQLASGAPGQYFATVLFPAAGIPIRTMFSVWRRRPRQSAEFPPRQWFAKKELFRALPAPPA
jgi:hypothetical protein